MVASHPNFYTLGYKLVRTSKLSKNIMFGLGFKGGFESNEWYNIDRKNLLETVPEGF